MNMIDELVKLLEERRAEYVGGGTRVEWYDGDHGYVAEDRMCGHMAVYGMTPRQAVDATLGRTCRNVAEPDEYSDRPFTCSECGARGPMGEGTYHMPSGFTLPDGTVVFGDSWPVWKYCPHCGRKVVSDRCETMAEPETTSPCEEAEQ